MSLIGKPVPTPHQVRGRLFRIMRSHKKSPAVLAGLWFCLGVIFSENRFTPSGSRLV
jgi:hypothetical protein